MRQFYELNARSIFCFALFILLSAFQTLTAQTLQLKGRVVDEAGESIIGAVIVVEGTHDGTVTDINGAFQIKVASENKIKVSYLGYASQTIDVGGRSQINITLQSDVTELDEVVVVGYREQTKATLTGAVTAVKSSDIESITSSDVVNSLSGRAAGVRIAQYSSEPGTFDTNIDIRGMGTPLIIIDGAERSQAEFSRLSNQEIESISILKDASAAIYGVQAANGVVLVTTKQGQKEKTKISYTGRYGVQLVTQFMEHVSSLQYGEMYNEISLNAAIKARNYFQYEDELWQSLRYDKEYFEATLAGEIETNSYVDLIMNKVAPQQQHSISMSGGGDKTTYFINLGYYNEEGLYKSGSLNSDKYNGRVNLSTQLSKDLKFNVNIGYINTIRNAPSSSLNDLFKAATTYPVNSSPYANGNSDYLSTSEWILDNPLAMADSDISGYENRNERFLQTNFELQYTVPNVKGLMLKARASYDNINYETEVYNKEYMLYDYNAMEDEYQAHIYNAPSSISQRFDRQQRFNTQLSANYNRRFKRHQVGGLLLFETRTSTSGYTLAATELAIDANPNINAGLNGSDAISGTESETFKLSTVARLNYNYDQRYILEMTARLDGTSKFPENSRWGVFPSVLGAWRFSQEKFIKNNASWLSNGKLRLSYGIMGDDAAANTQYQAGYIYPSGNTSGGNVNSVILGGYMWGDDWLNAMGVADVANEDLTWYTSRTFNAGIDLSFFKNKLYLEADYFVRNREGLLAYKTLSDPGYIGATLPQENLNSDRTSGFEVVLGYRGKIEDLNYNVSGNVSYTRTRWIHYEESAQATSYDDWRNSKSGRYTDIVWGYETDGVYQTFEEIAQGPIMDGRGNQSILPGTYKYIDQNGDGIINSEDIVPIGKGGGKPLLYFGLNLSADYKGFDFSMLWQGAAMNMVKYAATPLTTAFAFGYASPLEQMYDRWHCVNYDDPYNSASWVAGDYPAQGTPTAIDGGTADQLYFNANYLRLKSIEIGYTLPAKILRKTMLEACRVYISGYNLLTISAGHDFLDPEFNSGRNYTYPLTMNINLGIDLTF